VKLKTSRNVGSAFWAARTSAYPNVISENRVRSLRNRARELFHLHVSRLPTCLLEYYQKVLPGTFWTCRQESAQLISGFILPVGTVRSAGLFTSSWAPNSYIWQSSGRVKQIFSQGSYTALIFGPSKEMRDFEVITPRQNSSISTVVGQKIKRPKDPFDLFTRIILRAAARFPREELP
jgi:hypothetical protein